MFCQTFCGTKYMKNETKMGRPVLPVKEKRGETIRVRVSPPELKEIETAADASGEGFSEWTRKKLLAAARRAGN
jgi:hypothetical protein